MKLSHFGFIFPAILLSLSSFSFGDIASSTAPCDPSLGLPSICSCSATTVRCLFADLTDIPNRLPVNITHLDLRYNKIRKIHKRSFTKSHRSLEVIILSNNVVHSLQDDAFAALHSVKDLWLNSNGLKQISPHAFRGLRNLQTVHLEANEIENIHHSTFAPLHHLEKVFLYQNEIKKLPRDSFVRNSRLNRLRIDQNPIHCDCETLWLANTLRTLADTTGATCASPDELAGKALTTLTTNILRCESPRIVQEPSDIEADLGQSLQLECRAVGHPHPVIHWMHNDQEILPHHNHHHHRLMGDGMLQVDFSDDNAQGTYQCMAQSPVGEVMGRRISVRSKRQHVPARFLQRIVGDSAGVPRKPEFQTVPTDFDVRDGESIEIPCEVLGFPQPEVSWFKDGKVVVAEKNRVKVSASKTLQIEKPDQSHNGAYECVAQNHHGTVRAFARVRVRVRPVIIESPRNSNAYLGGRMTIRCRADGYPAPFLTWTQNGLPTPTDFVHDISRDGTELIFLNITREDQGTYKCSAQNSAGTASASATLTVFNDALSIPDGGDAGGSSVPRSSNPAAESASIFGSNGGDFRSLSPGTYQRVNGPRERNLTREQLQALDEARPAFESSLRLMDEKVKRGMFFPDLPAFTYNESYPYEQILLMAELSGCRPHRKLLNTSDCSGCYHKKYRTFDGTCNNLKEPMRGASYTPLRRLLPAQYDDGLMQPIGFDKEKRPNGFALPSARLVSTKVLATGSVTPDTRHSHMLMQWGQFLDHDLSFTLMEPSHEVFIAHANCKSSCTTQPPCFPIEIPANDTRLSNETCMEFIRSRPVCGSGSTSMLFNQLMPREQINTITSYIDASMIYGSTEEMADFIRDHNTRGLFRSSLPAPGTDLPLLPYNDIESSPEEIDCKRVRNDERNFPCFTAGEVRVNEQLGLLSMHIVWFREHNRIAEKLGELNPHWKADKVFQETRKIVAAQVQHITYTQWLPKILGPSGMQLLGFYQGYDESVDASIINSFATAALRIGHSLIFPVLRRLNSSFESIPEGDLSLGEAFFAPQRIFDQGGVDPILRGLFATPAKLLRKTELMNSELTEKLFGQSTRTHRLPLDLGALNIQRGRDHGLPPYVEFRKKCTLALPKDFQGLSNEVEEEQLARLQEVYGHVGNVDLFAGAMSERPLPGAKVGATFMCLLAEQFKNLRNGDRFWYEKHGEFSTEQLKEIKQASLSRILCENTDTIDRAQKDIFLLGGQQGGYSWCEDIPAIDLTPWTECCEDCYSNRWYQAPVPSHAHTPVISRRSRRNDNATDATNIQELQRRISDLEEMVSDLNVKVKNVPPQVAE